MANSNGKMSPTQGDVVKVFCLILFGIFVSAVIIKNMERSKKGNSFFRKTKRILKLSKAESLTMKS